jgi:hypothetical protein
MLRLIWEPRALASRSVILRRLLLVVRSGRLADAGPASCAALEGSCVRVLRSLDPSGRPILLALAVALVLVPSAAAYEARAG